MVSGAPNCAATPSIQSAVNLEIQPRNRPQLRHLNDARCIALPGLIVALSEPHRHRSFSSRTDLPISGSAAGTIGGGAGALGPNRSSWDGCNGILFLKAR